MQREGDGRVSEEGGWREGKWGGREACGRVSWEGGMPIGKGGRVSREAGG